MKEKPILFSGPMVRAILDGRKTQTRRALKRQPTNLAGPDYDGLWSDTVDPVVRYFACPYGQPGDRLWVRETWGKDDNGDVVFRTDDWCECPTADGKWKPSIFMPRAASRITLEITAVRAERLQDISEADARCEGVESKVIDGMARASYAGIWSAINSPDSWSKNPWVWVIEFCRTQPA